MWLVVKSKKRVVEALHNIAGSVLADQRNCSEKLSIEADLKDEVVPPVVPIGRERREMVPLAFQGMDRPPATFAAGKRPKGVVPFFVSLPPEDLIPNFFKIINHVAADYQHS